MSNEIEQILPAYSYIYDVFQIAQAYSENRFIPLRHEIHTINVYLIGSRLSGKTIACLRAMIEASFIKGLRVDSKIIRYEPKGAKETFDELLSVLWDIYGIEATRWNTNLTNKTFRLGHNKIKAIGVMTTKKRKQFKLGLAREGSKKDVQINFIEEATEFDSENQVLQVLQSIGGAKFTINLWASNPWIASMWYVKPFVQLRMFNKQILSTIGSVYKEIWHVEDKMLEIRHVNNHRINTTLSEGQHASLTRLHKIDPHLAMIADLGMAGISEGLIYAPILHNLRQPIILDDYRHVERIGGGLDWGTSTGLKGSAVSLTLGKIARNYKFLQIEKEYYHSNSKSMYKPDNELIDDLLDVILPYVKKNLGIIKMLGSFTVYVDYAAFGVITLLENRLLEREPMFMSLVNFNGCYKYKVPVRIDVLKHIISTERLRYDKDVVPELHSALERAQWDDTKMVDNRPTRLKEDDDPNDSLEYFINDDLLEFADHNWIQHNKLLRKGL